MLVTALEAAPSINAYRPVVQEPPPSQWVRKEKGETVTEVPRFRPLASLLLLLEFCSMQMMQHVRLRLLCLLQQQVS